MAWLPALPLADLAPGELKRVLVEGKTLLVARLADGAVTALEPTCPHARASLAFGVLAVALVLCPLHLGTIDVRSGGDLEPPACTGVARYPVRLDDGQVLVDLEGALPPDPGPALPLDAGDGRTFVLVGGGPASAAAARTLRAEGYRGRLVLVSDEPELPYERPDLSKAYLLGQKPREALAVLPPATWERLGVELRLGVRVIRLDAVGRRLELADGTTLAYDAALVATGATPRRPQAPGFDAANVLTLRTIADLDRLQAALPTEGRALDGGADGPSARARVLLVGAGFIGLELASTLRKKKLDVTLVAPEAVPLERIVGPQIGTLFADLHRANGVDLRLGRSIARLEGDTHVTAAVLDDGSRVETSLVIVGIGVSPATAFVTGAPRSERDGALEADATLRVTDGLWAAGDCVRFPFGPSQEPARIEHWRVAMQQGRSAARGMLGRPEPFAALPFFWTHQYTLLFQMVGYAAGWDEVVLQGEPSPKGFLAFYLRQGRLVAAAGAQKGRELAAISELMRLGAMPDTAALGNGVDWLARLREATMGSVLRS